MSEMQKERIEEMGEFFDNRADGYDEHMKSVVISFQDFYSSLSKPIKPTNEEIRILDLGCGTGLEIQWILEKAPRAQITGIDLSEKMLQLLTEKYIAHQEQLQLIKGSYLTVPFQEDHYDYIVSAMTMHHLLYDEKLALYEKIRKALKKDGYYIEGDYVETPELEKKWLEEFWRLVSENTIEVNGRCHYDIPCSLETEEKLFQEAGFKGFKVFWHEGSAAIYKVKNE